MLQPQISDLRNICGQDHSKKLTILENSVDAMQEQIQKCGLKEAITSKLRPVLTIFLSSIKIFCFGRNDVIYCKVSSRRMEHSPF